MTGTLLALTLLLQVAAPAPPRNGTVSGQIQTREGNPAVAVRVSAIPAPPPFIRESDGQNYWSTPAPASTALTGADGRYRLTNVPAGRYYIVAGMLGGATYFGGATVPEKATVVTLASGGSETIDFKLAVAHGGLLSGRVWPAGDGTPERAVLSGLKLEELLEMPIGADGRFTYGHVPRGAYLLSIFPTPPGMRSVAFEVGDADLALDIARPPVRVVSGTIKVATGPVPQGLLAFTTAQSHVSARINPDRTFTVRLHQGSHLADLVGLPVGYAIASVTAGGRDATRGLVVGGQDIPNVEITLTTPRRLPVIRGRLAGMTAGSPPVTVEFTGPIVGSITVPVRPDGAFEVPAITAGLYTVRVPERPAISPVRVVVRASDEVIDVALAAP